MLKMYTLPRVPGATDTTEWTEFCRRHNRFVVISHETHRATSRWQGVERKRKFRVSVYGHNKRFGHLYSMNTTYHATYEKADKYARIMAVEYDPSTETGKAVSNA